MWASLDFTSALCKDPYRRCCYSLLASCFSADRHKRRPLEIAVGIPLTWYPPRGPGRALISVGPGRWSGQSGKELVLAEPFLHPETERRATEVSRFGSGVWLEHRSLAWLRVPCAEQWLTVGAAQLIPFGRVSSIAQLGRCLQLRKRATSEKDTGR